MRLMRSPSERILMQRRVQSGDRDRRLRASVCVALVVSLAILGGVAVAAVGGAGASAPGGHAVSATTAPDLPTSATASPALETASLSPAVRSSSSSGSTISTSSTSTTATSSTASSTRLSPSSTAVQSGGSIVERVEYSLLPAQPDRVEARISYEIPDDVQSLRFGIVYGEYEIAGLDGFTETDEGTFEWDGTGSGGTVTIRHDVSESFREGDVTGTYVGGTADWAVVTRPQTRTTWSYSTTNPGLAYEMAPAGEGYAGDRFAFLGPYELHTETVGGEQLSLVVPDAADPASSPTAILDSVAYASEQLHFGDTNRNDEVVLIAAPTDGVDWSPPGLAIGSDARISADAAVDDPLNIWVHEYVHTRQYRDADRSGGDAIADDAHWLIEGSAEYYAALTSYEQGLIDFETFQAVLERGTQPPADDAVLADRSTWASTDAEYEKGALVVGAIDRQLRAATDGETTFQALMERWNTAGTFSGDDLESAAGELGGDSVESFVETHTRTDATPSVWDRDTHEALFTVEQSRFEYTVISDPPLSVASPYRTGELGDTLAVGENVTTRIRIENVADAGGNYRATITVDGQVLAAATGTIGPGETATANLTAQIDQTGDVRIVAGDYARTVTVVEPATPAVEELHVTPQPAVAGDSVDVVATVSNPTNAPADGTITIHADGEVIGSERVRLAPGGNDTVAITTTFESTGSYEITAGNLSVAVTVEDPGPLDLVPPVAIAVVAIALFAGVLGFAVVRRRL